MTAPLLRMIFIVDMRGRMARGIWKTRAERSGLSMVSRLDMARAREVEKMVETVK